MAEAPRGRLGGVAPGRPALPGGPYLVIGLARSGEAAALALRARGEEVIGCDAGTSATLLERAGRLRAAGVEVHLDASPDALAASAATIVKSPGVPGTLPLIRDARSRGIPVLGELELAWRLLPNEFVAVTGTNGKTTSTEWIGHIHRAAGAPCAVAGNVGVALSGLVGTLAEDATVICEASSFQLEDAECFRPEVGVLLNLTPDHLDRHGSFERYTAAKLRMFARQTEDDAHVLADALPLKLPGRGRSICFGTGHQAQLRHVDGALTWRGERLLGVNEIRLPGEHNLQNGMAAAAACLVRGLPAAVVAEGLRTFAGVAHRLELLATRGGVDYVNDSKATNVASTVVALQSFPGGVRLIAGGRGKAQDFSALAPLVDARCAAVYLIGEDAERMQDELAAAGANVPLRRCAELDRAVTAATRDAQPGETVLLSPACASFDQFDDFEARGEAFRALVEALG